MGGEGGPERGQWGRREGGQGQEVAAVSCSQRGRGRSARGEADGWKTGWQGTFCGDDRLKPRRWTKQHTGPLMHHRARLGQLVLDPAANETYRARCPQGAGALMPGWGGGGEEAVTVRRSEGPAGCGQCKEERAETGGRQDGGGAAIPLG